MEHKSKTAKRRAAPQPAENGAWELRLYVAGRTARCMAAFANLKQMCEEHVAGQYKIEVIDLLETPSYPGETRSWPSPRW